MSSSKHIDRYRDYAAGVHMSEAQNAIPPPPLHTVYVYTVYLFTQGTGEGGRVELEGYSSESWVENTNMNDCISSL